MNCWKNSHFIWGKIVVTGADVVMTGYNLCEQNSLLSVYEATFAPTGTMP
jgi:hypothetical protein